MPNPNVSEMHKFSINSPNNGKRGKAKTTVQRIKTQEELRAEFVKIAGNKLDRLLDAMDKKAITKENALVQIHLLEQLIGKPTQKVEGDVKHNITINIQKYDDSLPVIEQTGEINKLTDGTHAPDTV